MAGRISVSRAAALLRRGRRGPASLAHRGGGHGPATPPPPFVRLRKPDKKLHPESELAWDDGVAPEMALDLDVPHIAKGEGLRWFLGGLGAFASVALGIAVVHGPESKRK